MKKTIKQFIFKEYTPSGDFSNPPGSAPSPYGYGRAEVPFRQEWNGLNDKEETKKPYQKYNDDYDDHPHLLPHEDQMLRELTGNDPNRSKYSDLPGFPRMNSLTNKKNFIPQDQDQNRDFPEEVPNSTVKLIPTGKDDKKPEYWGYGSLDDLKPQDGLKLSMRKNTFEQLNLQGNPSANDWKSTTQQNLGNTQRDLQQNKLVNQHDFFIDIPGEDKNNLKKFDDNDDVITRPGSMGLTVSPKNHIPNGGDMTPPESLGRHIKEAIKEAIMEKAPPGMEDVVLSLKKKYGENSPKPFAIAWAKYNKANKK